MRTAVFLNDTWHPADIIRRGFNGLGELGFDFDWLETPAAWAAANLDDYAFVVLAKGNTTSATDRGPWLSPAREASFLRHVRAGKGLLIVHAGSCYRENADLRALTGGAFLSHPPQCSVNIEPKAGHALTAGVPAPFAVHDEHYMMVLDDPQADVFLHANSEHGLQPAGWTRTEKRADGADGRICVLTPGHNEGVWQHPAFQTLLRNGLAWASSSGRGS